MKVVIISLIFLGNLLASEKMFCTGIDDNGNSVNVAVESINYCLYFGIKEKTENVYMMTVTRVDESGIETILEKKCGLMDELGSISNKQISLHTPVGEGKLYLENNKAYYDSISMNCK